MAKYVVTGAAGFIGSAFCRYLNANYKNCQVYGIDNINGIKKRIKACTACIKSGRVVKAV